MKTIKMIKNQVKMIEAIESINGYKNNNRQKYDDLLELSQLVDKAMDESRNDI